ncbi:hypothetical protein ACUW6V_000182 [Cronobacter sp. 153480017-3]|uniref:Uncharacterized protein n=1 Tax=Cronobacter sakazakii (strain ATCC BAA-894) TaxID=290339 RepID=A7MLC3_CROS8|nr:hypothetical protein ESA_01763 [Cronobacter sakazakii ATCC BAA-894]CCK02526.1 hypothetical protein BN129_1081 [Cronobacter sakazakii 701]
MVVQVILLRIVNALLKPVVKAARIAAEILKMTASVPQKLAVKAVKAAAVRLPDGLAGRMRPA